MGCILLLGEIENLEVDSMEYLLMEGKGVYVFSAYGFSITCLSILAVYLLSARFRTRKSDRLVRRDDSPTITSDDIKTK